MHTTLTQCCHKRCADIKSKLDQRPIVAWDNRDHLQSIDAVIMLQIAP